MKRRIASIPARVASTMAAATLIAALLGSCRGNETDAACAKSVSVSGYIVDLSQGLDNRAESEYAQFRLDSLDVFELVGTIAGGDVGADDQTRAAAMVLRDEFTAFSNALDELSWDLSRAAANPDVVELWRNLISPQTLGNSNLVEAWIISRCGLPSRVTSNGDGPERLPDPSIPSPTATDPPTGPVNDQSEQQALGTVVATLFSLNITPSQASCLGGSLSDVGAPGDSVDDPSFSRSEYQRAFDACGINFTVPAG